MIGNWVASGAGRLGAADHRHSFGCVRIPSGSGSSFSRPSLPGLYSLAVLLYRKMSVHYLLTNQRFIHESGFFRRVTNRIEVLDMDDISFEQALVERMLGVGTIRILSSDRLESRSAAPRHRKRRRNLQPPRQHPAHRTPQTGIAYREYLAPGEFTGSASRNDFPSRFFSKNAMVGLATLAPRVFTGG